MEFDVIAGDIAAQTADVLVNAAGTSLEMGSGVAGALREAGGEELNAAAVANGPIDLGSVAVTDAFALDADYVVHAAAMPHYGDGQAREWSIAAATHNALHRADRLDCESLVIPALGCGVAGFDLAAGAAIVGREIDRFAPATLDDVRFIAFDADAAATIRDAV